MSCSKCGSVNTSCGCKDTAYTTPKVYTCPPDTSCPQPVRCSEFMDAACIFLNDGIADAGIQPGSSLESIVQQLILLVTNPGCVDAPGGVPGGGTVNFVDAVWPGNAIIIDGGPIQNSGQFVFNGQGTSNQYIDGQGNLQDFPAISGPVEFQTNGTPNSVQDLLNLVAGTGITLTESGGSVTIDVDAVDYTVQNGLSEQPLDSGTFELGAPNSPGAPLLHDTYIAGSQYGFEINNTSTMYLQGNRVDVEGADPGVKILSTGGTSDNSLEVTGTQTALESTTGANSTRIFLDPTHIKIQTPLFNLKNNNDVLTLIDKTTGEVEFAPITGALFQTNGTDNNDQTFLNLVAGNGITLTNSSGPLTGGDVIIDGPLFQTNYVDNGVQTLLNIIPGTGISITESSGNVTINAEAATNLIIQNEGTNLVTNPTIINFVGDGVNATNPSGSVVTVTIPGGGGPGAVDANNGLILDTTDPDLPIVQLGGPDTAPAPLIRNTYITTATPIAEFDFDISGTRATKPILNVTNSGQGSAVKGNSTGGYSIYGVTASGFAGYFEGDSSLITTYSVNKTGNLAAQLESVSNVNNTIIPVLRVTRTVDINNTGINGANGIGGAVDFVLEDNNNIAAQAGAISYEFTDATSSSVVSKFAVTTANASTITKKLEITGAGQLILNNYTTATSFDPESGASVGVLNVDNTGKVFVGGGGNGINVQVDGTALSSTTLLNFVPSTNIGVQDLGDGKVQFDLLNPYTVNNGLSSQTTPSVDTNNFQLGGPVGAPAPLIHDTYIQGVDKSLNLTFDGLTTTNGFNISSNNPNATGVNTQRLSTIILNGANSVPGVTTSSLYVENNRTGIGRVSIAGFFKGDVGVQAEGPVAGVYGISVATGVSGEGNNIGVKGYSVSGTGVDGSGFIYGGSFTVATGPSAGAGVYGAAENATFGAVAGVSQNGVAGYFRANSTGISDSKSVLRIVRDSTGTTSAGFAARIDFGLKTGSSVGSADGLASYIETKLINATPGNEAVELAMYTAAPSANTVKFTILGGGTSGPAGAWSLTPGQIKFNRYAGGAIYKSANDLSTNSGFNLGIDANGNIWATDFSTTTGPVTGVSNISIGTLSNGASATVSNPSGPAATINITGQNAYTQIGSDSGTASADAYNAKFNVVGARGVSTSLTNDTSPNADVITVNGPDKYYKFQIKDINNTNITNGLYTPSAWDSTLNIRAGNGITLANDTLNNGFIISTGGSGYVTNVSGTDANGFTFNITNPGSTPNITLGTGLTGILVGNGTGMTAIAPPTTGSSILVYNATTGTYSYQTAPTVNDGTLTMNIGTTGATGTSVTWDTATGYSANTATNTTYSLRVGPALSNLATKMAQAMPTNPAQTAGGITALPAYIYKSAVDSYELATPVTTFSPGSTGFNVSSAVSTTTSGAINGAVVLGGTLNVTSGGTGLSTAPTNGQILIGNGTGFTLANLQGTGGITIENNAGGITIGNTGVTPVVNNGLHIHTAGGSSAIRLGSGTTGDTITPLIELTNIRMGTQIYKLSNENLGYIKDVGFQINDIAGQKLGYLGSSTNTTVDGANAPAFGFVFSGFGGTALTAYNGVYIDNTSTTTQNVYTGFSTLTRQVITRSSTAANNKLIQVGSWGGTNDITFYEAIPSAQTIQVGPTGGNNTQIIVNDSLGRFIFNKGIIYGTNNYGTATPVGLNGLTTARYILGTASDGKFYEIPGISIGSIKVGADVYTPTTLATAAVPNQLTIQGAGTVGVSLSGTVLTITGGAINYWKDITTAVTAGSTGTITGPSTISPAAVGPNTFQFNAGSGIGIRTVAPVAGSSTGALLEITNNGLLSLVTGGVNTFSIVSAVGNPGALTLNIPYQWRTINLTNTGAVPSGSTNATSVLTPNQALSDITFNGGSGITIDTNTSSRTVTISASGSGTALPATNGVWVNTTPNPDEYQLGSNSDGPSTFTENRFINAQGSSLQIKGTPATGTANGILKLLSSTAGRGLRVENSLASNPDGAIYATANQGSTGADTSGGIILAELGSPTTNLGSAVVGFGSTAQNELTRPAILGSGYVGVKGVTKDKPQTTTAAGGIGVYGVATLATSPTTITGSVYGVAGSTISASQLLVPSGENLGTGVYGESVGSVGTGLNKSFGGRFLINSTGAVALGALGLRSLNNVGNVLSLVRLSSDAAIVGIGNAIEFNIEGNTNVRGVGNTAGRIGYKFEDIGSPVKSRFFASVVGTDPTINGGGTVQEYERLAIKNTGQLYLSGYTRTFDPATATYTPTYSLPYTNTNNVDANLLAVSFPLASEDQGQINQLSIASGLFTTTVTIPNTGPWGGTAPTITINSFIYKKVGNLVECKIRGSLPVQPTFVSGSNAKQFRITVPYQYNNGIGNITNWAGSFTLNSPKTTSGVFDDLSIIIGGSNTIILQLIQTANQPSSIYVSQNDFYIDFTYLTN